MSDDFIIEVVGSDGEAAVTPGAEVNITVAADESPGLEVTQPSGDRGPQGDVGPVGPAGPQGAVGPAGPQGAVGPAGPQGAPAATVEAYATTGDPGTNATVTPTILDGGSRIRFDLTIPRGSPGVAGAVGPAGPAGPQGIAGPQGEVGPQGIAGAVGPAGPQGPAGVAGPAGPAGPQGAVGPQGVAGAVGPAGPQGAVGPAGPAGPQGPAGTGGVEWSDVPLRPDDPGTAGDIARSEDYLYVRGSTFWKRAALSSWTGVPTAPQGVMVTYGSPAITAEQMSFGSNQNPPTFGGAEIDVEWEPPLSTGGATITGYRVRFGNINDDGVVLSAAARSHTFTNVGWSPRYCTYYDVIVTAINVNGESPPGEAAPGHDNTPYDPGIRAILPTQQTPVLFGVREGVYGTSTVLHRLAWSAVCVGNGTLRQVIPGVNGPDAIANPTGPVTLLPHTHYQVQWMQTFYNYWIVLTPQPPLQIGGAENYFVTTVNGDSIFTAPGTSIDVNLNGDQHHRSYRVRTARLDANGLWFGEWSNVIALEGT
jgi:hypothetical protein